LAHELFEESRAWEIENGFLDKLQHAKSNIAEHKNGAEIYRKWVRTTRLSIEQVAAHWAIASVFETGPAIYCYTVDPSAYQTRQSENYRLVVGRARVCSQILTE